MPMAGNMDATERQRAVGTQQIVDGVLKGTHSMVVIYPAIHGWIPYMMPTAPSFCFFDFFNFTA